MGGNITLVGDVILPSKDSVIRASSQLGSDGNVVLESANDVYAEVVDIEVPDEAPAEPISNRCTPAELESRSSLVARTVNPDAVKRRYLSAGSMAAVAPCDAL